MREEEKGKERHLIGFYDDIGERRERREDMYCYEMLKTGSVV